MKPNTLKPARGLKVSGVIRTPWALGKGRSLFYGAEMTGLPATREAVNRISSQKIRQVTNNLYFHNRVNLRVSLDYSAGVREYGLAPGGRVPGVKDFARDLIDRELRRELDSELALMARGENVSANQRRQKMLGKYLLSKPYTVIRNFYGARMQTLAANPPSGLSREKTEFHSDIIHERTSETVSSTIQTQTERISGSPTSPAAISGGDLDRIAAQAALKVEKRMRADRERIGKWR